MAEKNKLIECSKTLNVKGVQELLNAGENPNVTDKNNFSPLHYASKNKQVEKNALALCQALLDKNAQIMCRDKNNRTPLHYAAHDGNSDIANLLLAHAKKQGISVKEYIDLTDVKGYTSLHYSSVNGHRDVSKILLDQGGSAHVMNTRDNTPLHAAATNGDPDMVKMLVAKLNKEQINTHNSNSYSALQIAAEKGLAEVCSILLKAGADPNAASNNTDSPHTPLHAAAYSGNTDVLKILTKANGKLEAKGHGGWVTMHYAAFSGHPDTIKAIHKEKPGLLDTKDDCGKTAIFYAAQEGHYEALRVLLELGAKTTILDDEGHSVAHSAIINGQTEVLKVLSNFSKAGKGPGGTGIPLHVAIEQGNEAAALTIIQEMHNKKQDLVAKLPNGKTSLHLAAEAGIVSVIKELMDKGHPKNITDVNNRTPLHAAIEAHNLHGVSAMCTPDMVNLADEIGLTPLHLAARDGEVDIIRLLIQKGAKPGQKDHRKRVPLHFSTENGHLAANAELLKLFNESNLQDENGRTCLHYAAMNLNHEKFKMVLDQMLKHSIKVNIVDKAKARSPLHYLAVRYEVDSYNYLLKNGAKEDLVDNNLLTPAQILQQKKEETLALNEEETELKKPELYKIVEAPMPDDAEFLRMAAIEDERMGHMTSKARHGKKKGASGKKAAGGGRKKSVIDKKSMKSVKKK